MRMFFNTVSDGSRDVLYRFIGLVSYVLILRSIRFAYTVEIDFISGAADNLLPISAAVFFNNTNMESIESFIS